MRNAILPLVSSQLYNFGSDEAQVSNLEVSTSVNELNVHATDFYSEPSILDDSNQLADGGFMIPYQSLISNQSASIGFLEYRPSRYQYSPSSFNNISHPLMQCSQAILPETKMDCQATNTVKGSIAVNNGVLQRDTGDLNESGTGAQIERNKNKRKKASSEGKLWRAQDTKANNIQANKIPVRRSQKLSDKITALQKLVSPYGKTDTASVLQEACLYIRLLQEQIQNLFQMMSDTYNKESPLHQSLGTEGEQVTDIRSRGFCLVPISLIQSISQEF
ncbi:hypothetical protein K2173_011869 [Erythroxylum novogranatense]|uniref:BHLH domain-containing protein n=1 Tax=Erythroxylum novogranatense TaxID=1862640 RepID=A0AAV8T0N6_9ROSI|nr:hypothetical protein K2173_011869 [Erythroxylum novogranatense]